MFKKPVQRGHSERRGEAYSFLYVEPLSDARTKLADFFNILIGLLHLIRIPPYPAQTMNPSDLTLEQLKELVRGLVDDRLRELLGDPDLGLQLGEGLRTRLKESLASSERLSGEELANQLGLRW